MRVVVSDTILIVVGREKIKWYMAPKVSRLCLLVLMIKVNLR